MMEQWFVAKRVPVAQELFQIAVQTGLLDLARNVAFAYDADEAQQIATEHNSSERLRNALERLLVATYTGDLYEEAQQYAKDVMDAIKPGWADKYI